jgi:RNA polymerase sigma-70 factor (ECF subfamily)
LDPEYAIVDAAASGDRHAFDELVRRYQVAILGLARALLAGSPDAEDVTQEVFVRVWRSLPAFRGESSFKSWVHRIALNVIVSHQRRLMRERRVFRGTPADTPIDGAGVPAPGDMQRDILSRLTLDRALGQMPLDLRTALVLRDLQGLDYKDIAHTLGVPLGTVESRIFRARKRLRTLVDVPNPSDLSPLCALDGPV